MESQVRKYGFINAKLRARLTRLLDDRLIDQVIDAPTLDDALLLLRETPFSDIEQVYKRSGDLKAVDLELFKHEIKLYQDLKRYLHREVLDVVQALVLHTEIENVKNAVRLFFDRSVRGRDIDVSSQFLLTQKIEHPMDVQRIAHAEDMGKVVQLLSQSPYGDILRTFRVFIEKEQSLFRFEIALDRYYYNNLIAKIQSLKNRDRKIALRIVGIEIDLLNVNWIIRFRNFYDLSRDDVLDFTIPHGHSIDEHALMEVYASENITRILKNLIMKRYPSLAVFLSYEASDAYSRILLIEQVLDQILLVEVKKMLSGYPFSIGTVLAYVILQRRDIRRIGTALHAKQYNMTKERIRGIF
jgi:V/A-type H+-transporting ATPase subunit C